MSSKGEIFRKFSLRRCILGIIILCTSGWWASADAVAQEAVRAPLAMTARATLWSFEGPGLNTTPHLVIGMADSRDTLSYGSLRPARGEAANPSASNAISRTVGPVASVNSAEKGESGRLVMSSLFEPTAGFRDFTDFHAEGTIRHQILQSSPDQTGAKVYTLLGDGPPPGPSLYGYRMRYFLSKQWLADSESFKHEKSSSTRLASGATSRTIRQAATIVLLISVSQFPHGH